MNQIFQSLTTIEKIGIFVAGIFILVAAFLVLYLIIISVFPKCSPNYRRLKKYGNPQRILKECEKELRENPILSRGTLSLTPKYLVENAGLRFIIPLESVLWVFELQSMRYSLRKRRNKMHYSLQIVTITGDSFLLRDKQIEDLKKIEEVLEERYPNFFYGYSEEHDEMVHYILNENKKELREAKKKK